jgi:hypothetical protein
MVDVFMVFLVLSNPTLRYIGRRGK